jgi:hypothetical protein
MRPNRCPRCRFVAPIKGPCPHCVGTQRCGVCKTPIAAKQDRHEIVNVYEAPAVLYYHRAKDCADPNYWEGVKKAIEARREAGLMP